MLLRQKGPIVLAGHSYGGAVITAAAAGNPNVKALVYIAAIVPDEGETVGDVFRRVSPHASAAQAAARRGWIALADGGRLRECLRAGCIGVRNCSVAREDKALPGTAAFGGRIDVNPVTYRSKLRP